jgi:hypothetical protein
MGRFQFLTRSSRCKLGVLDVGMALKLVIIRFSYNRQILYTAPCGGGRLTPHTPSPHWAGPFSLFWPFCLFYICLFLFFFFYVSVFCYYIYYNFSDLNSAKCSELKNVQNVKKFKCENSSKCERMFKMWKKFKNVQILNFVQILKFV